MHRRDKDSPAGQQGAQSAVPRYQEIAADFAKKLVNGEYQEGDRVYARSALASQYGVSSETARRAICVLADIGVVEASRGSGVTILSIDKAVEFLHHYSDSATIIELKDRLLENMLRQKEEMESFAATLDELVQKAKHYKAENPFSAYKIVIQGDCPKLGKSLGELNFWHYTGATVVSVERGGVMILSPGPHAAMREGDTLYYVGNADCVERVHSLLGK